MCRLYGFHSTIPHRVECELIRSQNSLIEQSRRDETGESHPDGWGLVAYNNGSMVVERQSEPAFTSDEFRWAAGQAFSRTVLAHVRKATIGVPEPRNTHPFVFGDHAFVHNGTIAAIDLIRAQIIDFIGDPLRKYIGGATDSEHFFFMLTAEYARNGIMADSLARCLATVARWSQDADPDAELAINTIWTDGKSVVGSRRGRSLWWTRRDRVRTCEVCGERHGDSPSGSPYRAVVLASQRITDTDEWNQVAEESVFEVDGDFRLRMMSL